MKTFLGRIGAFVLALIFGAWTLFNVAINTIGKTTVVDDFNLLVERLPAIFGWLYSTPWWVPAILASLLTGLFVWLSWPRPYRQVPPNVPYDPSLYTYDPQNAAADRRAYYDLMGFIVNFLVPACERQIALQKEIIQHLSANETVAELAIEGFHQDTRPVTRDFWKHYVTIIHGIDSSEPTMKFKTMVDSVRGLERNSYRIFCEQLDEIANSSGLDYRNDPDTRPLWEQWRQHHNALIREYDKVRKDARFDKLFRPLREGRWGSAISDDPNPRLAAPSGIPSLPDTRAEKQP